MTLRDIFPNGEHLKCGKRGADLVIDWGAMYEAPELTAAHGKALEEFFGTADVRLNYNSTVNPGCESCDWGSNYGHSIQIHGATKNADLEGNWSER